MNIQIKSLSDQLGQYIQILANILRSYSEKERPKSKIRTNLLFRDNIIFGYISFTPHNDPEEESIEVIINIKSADECIRYTVDICWTDGEIINEITDVQVSGYSENEILDNIIKLNNQGEQEIIKIMKNLIKNDLPPRYRSR